MDSQNLSRREFVKKGVLVGAAFTVLPRHVLGDGCLAPSDEITKAVIGTGGQGMGHLALGGNKLLAVCDVDSGHLQNALDSGGAGVKGYKDFREVLARSDIDLVHIPTPPHWHALISIAAANAGKDVWCEKPMTRTIGEGKAVIDACKRNGTMFRLNTWFRFQDNLYGLGRDARFCKKLVNSGALGTPLTCTIGANSGFDWKLGAWSGMTNWAPQSVPAALDYDFWLGPAPWKPYHSHHVHGSFRGYWDYDGGGLGDMGMHYLDPAQYILGKDGESPVEIIPETANQNPYAVTPWRRITMKYKDGTTLILDGDNTAGNNYLEGPKGRLGMGGVSNLDVNTIVAAQAEPPAMVTNFTTSIRTRKKFALNEVNGHRSTTLVNLAKISIQLNRKLNFDSDKQVFIDDDQANRYIDEPMRSPWTIEEMGI